MHVAGWGRFYPKWGSLRCSDCPCSGWSDAVLPPEAAGEMRRVAEAHLKGDLGDCSAVREQEVVGALKAETAEEIPGGTAGEGHQLAVQLGSAESDLMAQFFDREVLIRQMTNGNVHRRSKELLFA